jgi:membrane peptidoglycan carboxypeptidase
VGDPDTYSGKRESLNGRTIGGTFRRNVYGATLPGPIWKKIMTAASKGMEVKQFDQPASKYLTSPKKAVPDVRGKSPDEAKAILKEAGFEVRIADDPAQSQYPEGSVASTSPNGGSSAAEGSEITITISAGGGDGQGDGQGDGNGQGNGQGNGNGQGDGNGNPNGQGFGTGDIFGTGGGLPGDIFGTH